MKHLFFLLALTLATFSTLQAQTVSPPTAEIETEEGIDTSYFNPRANFNLAAGKNAGGFSVRHTLLGDSIKNGNALDATVDFHLLGGGDVQQALNFGATLSTSKKKGVRENPEHSFLYGLQVQAELLQDTVDWVTTGAHEYLQLLAGGVYRPIRDSICSVTFRYGLNFGLYNKSWGVYEEKLDGSGQLYINDYSQSGLAFGPKIDFNAVLVGQKGTMYDLRIKLDVLIGAGTARTFFDGGLNIFPFNSRVGFGGSLRLPGNGLFGMAHLSYRISN